ncbi:MAG: DegT/DnrJ/EryC1/StrS family aminotransferase [Alphaproteobacteria bacterium]|nr:DegT/DnrJ/EryC1/StrS family aminotransferase [Alphaproteobacteria bacterium]
MSQPNPIAFVDLKAQYEAYRQEIDSAIATVLEHGKFIMGPEVASLENELASFCGAKHAIGCSSGTDALMLIMMAEGVGTGDAIFVPSFTFTATAEVPLLLGATPIFVDVDPSDFNMALVDLEKRIQAVIDGGELRPCGILATDLFGLPADYTALEALAAKYNVALWSDAAQSFGGALGNRKVGSLSRATATSFFPAKPLGCYGDGGAVLTNDDELADVMKSIRAHGKGGEKYDIVRVGLNARLDTLQAAVLRAKLPHFASEIEVRNRVADAYDAKLNGFVETPARRRGHQSAWAQYTIKLPADRRDAVAAALKADGVPCAVYYPMPMHLQSAYRHFGDGEGSLPVSEALSGQVLSLPMHPFLTEPEIDRIADAVKSAVGSR